MVAKIVPSPRVPLAPSIEDHWITLDGARMRYLRSGEGRLSLLHGLLGMRFPGVCDSPSREAGDRHAVDMLGVGLSDRPLLRLHTAETQSSYFCSWIPWAWIL